MENNFETIYQELYDKNSSIFQEAKKVKNTRILATLLFSVVINLIFYFLKMNQSLLIACIAISALILICVIAKETTEYGNKFKESVVSELIKKYNSKLRFAQELGVPEGVYNISGFDKSYDRYQSEDCVKGIIGENIKYEMSQVVTKEIRKTTNAKGEIKRETVETFRGIFGVAKIEKNIDTEILISTNSLFKKFFEKRVEMDSVEFEENYDCFSEDRMLAMKIFTSDLLEKFVNLKETNLNKILLKIKNNNIYFRIECGEIFEAPQLKDALDKKTIKKYYDVISVPIELIEKIDENIKRT